jgi:hypothetical protein
MLRAVRRMQMEDEEEVREVKEMPQPVQEVSEEPKVLIMVL